VRPPEARASDASEFWSHHVFLKAPNDEQNVERKCERVDGHCADKQSESLMIIERDRQIDHKTNAELEADIGYVLDASIGTFAALAESSVFPSWQLPYFFGNAWLAEKTISAFYNP
jgi:hypothetical protein